MSKDNSYSKIYGSMREILVKRFGTIIKTHPRVNLYFIGRLLAF